MRGSRRRACAAFFFLAAFALCRVPVRARAVTIEVLSEEEDAPQAPANAASVPLTAQATPSPDGQRPRALIYHTHTYEAYEMTDETAYAPTETWRTADEAYNMVRVGEELAREMEAVGFEVVHDRTAFEPPDLSSAYTRSLEMLKARMDAGERYDLVLDVHRDAYSGLYNGANAVDVGGVQAAYVMLLVGKGTGTTGSGFDERPDWPQNLALAERITGEMNALAPGITREVKVKTGRFNQHVSTGALLIEVGNNRNTLPEALAACPVIARALADVIAQGAQ